MADVAEVTHVDAQGRVHAQLVFGVDRDPGVVMDGFERVKTGALKHNPMPVLYGPGPDDKRCRDCVHCHAGHSRRWFKCDLREFSNSTRTDHRATWPTCGKFEQDPSGRA